MVRYNHKNSQVLLKEIVISNQIEAYMQSLTIKKKVSHLTIDAKEKYLWNRAIRSKILLNSNQVLRKLKPGQVWHNYLNQN